MFSKVAICNGSYTRHKETNPIMLFGLLLHIAWVYALHSQLDHPWLAAWISFMWQGSLSLQLVGNHYSKPWVEINEQKYVSFPARQIEVNVNYKCSRWFDWVFGGLNFHNEHHVMPCMPRYNLRLISPDIKAMMMKYDMPYEFHWYPKVLY